MKCGCKSPKKKCSCGNGRADYGSVSFSTSQMITPGSGGRDVRYSEAEGKSKKSKARSLAQLIEEKRSGAKS